MAHGVFAIAYIFFLLAVVLPIRGLLLLQACLQLAEVCLLLVQLFVDFQRILCTFSCKHLIGNSFNEKLDELDQSSFPALFYWKKLDELSLRSARRA